MARVLGSWSCRLTVWQVCSHAKQYHLVALQHWEEEEEEGEGGGGGGGEEEEEEEEEEGARRRGGGGGVGGRGEGRGRGGERGRRMKQSIGMLSYGFVFCISAEDNTLPEIPSTTSS